MYLSNLKLINFRNIESLNIKLNPGITILYGDNGQGKTNIVESIYLLLNGTSFRTKSSKELIISTFTIVVITLIISFTNIATIF